MEARQYRELLRISAVPIMKIEYFNFHAEKYEAIINPKAKDLPPPAPGPALQADSPETKVVMMGLFSAMKKNAGYGGLK